MNSTITVQNVKFYDDTLLAIQDKTTGIIYTAINQILKNLGFDEKQINYQRTKWTDDTVIQKGVKKFLTPSPGGSQNTYCIAVKKLPLALAKINITAKIKNQYPDIAQKLERYQDECADVLADYFIDRRIIQNSPAVPLTREELAAYMMHNSQIIDGAKNSNEVFLKNIRESNEALLTQQYHCMDAMMNFVREFCSLESERAERYGSMMASGLYSLNRTMDSFNKFITSVHSTAVSTVSGNILSACGSTEDELWKQNAFNKANRICKELNLGNGNTVLNKVYSVIRTEDGIDLTQEKDKYMSDNNLKTVSMITVISHSEKLRDIFDRRMAELPEIIHSSGEKPDDKEKTYYSQVVKTTPKSVFEIIRPLTDNGISKITALKKVYKVMEQIGGISLADITHNYASDHNVKTVSKGYVIGQNKKLMQLMEKAVSSMIKNMR